MNHHRQLAAFFLAARATGFLLLWCGFTLSTGGYHIRAHHFWSILAMNKSHKASQQSFFTLNLSVGFVKVLFICVSFCMCVCMHVFLSNKGRVTWGLCDSGCHSHDSNVTVMTCRKRNQNSDVTLAGVSASKMYGPKSKSVHPTQMLSVQMVLGAPECQLSWWWQTPSVDSSFNICGSSKLNWKRRPCQLKNSQAMCLFCDVASWCIVYNNVNTWSCLEGCADKETNKVRFGFCSDRESVFLVQTL